MDDPDPESPFRTPAWASLNATIPTDLQRSRSARARHTIDLVTGSRVRGN